MNKRLITELVILFVLTVTLISVAQVTISGGSFPPFLDSNVLVMGSSDKTKGFRFEADTNITTGTTRVYTAPNSNGTMVVDDGSSFTPPTGLLTFGRVLATGFTPTCAVTTWSNVTGAIVSGSTDMAGACRLTCGTSCDNNGLLTLTFSTGSAYGGTAPICVANAAKAGASWQQNASVRIIDVSTTEAQFAAVNASPTGAVALTNTSTYDINYICFGRP